MGNAVLPDNIIPIPFDQSPSFALIPPHRHSEGPNGSICIARRYSPLPFLSWRKCSLSYWSRMVPKMLFRRWQPSIRGRKGGGTADTGKAMQARLSYLRLPHHIHCHLDCCQMRQEDISPSNFNWIYAKFSAIIALFKELNFKCRLRWFPFFCPSSFFPIF